MNRAYVKHNGSWRHVYIVNEFYQKTIMGTDERMIEFKLSEKTRTTHAAPAHKFQAEKPQKEGRQYLS